ncbi:E3 ubiquitin-protein ligase HEL2 NDAI_0H00830 [Naumovozyma dairenensis CBS 421]|uniref:RING-type E3 ubiquitin transferase n=1 Tax=Naumovozyma dairenensis (strain ATCC 10597 / BCRC 20456 / CBS 421 / NBRC 0211 / NRRL Y-12639) TaxID=1071378 RepID=G0WEP6_NAUDC|nr:hypothetical protein NDAI_0H00830 [Naumovozyma dairenensis CBS 421]CCD26257.1 hypothetical protein NDAI_0H00830 [Naumovozyma dairenensis CBS 421]
MSDNKDNSTSKKAQNKSANVKTSNSNNNKKKESNGKSKSNTNRRSGNKKDTSMNTPSVSKKKLEENNEEEEEYDGDDICLICASKMTYAALSPCHHKTCHRCSFRQRSLFEKKACLICRTENETLIFTENVTATYEDFINYKLDQFYAVNEKFGINFTSSEVAKATLDLLKYICPVCERNNKEIEDLGNAKKYNAHLKHAHNKCICTICVHNNHQFPRELKIYTQKQLQTHQSKGDTEGFKGHPLCAFCSGQRFYSDDELYVHMRNKHEKCHICDKVDYSTPQYFKDYDQLFEHFKNFHFICTFQTCLDNKFTVFKDEVELQAHILKEHGDVVRGKPKLFQSNLSTFMSTPSTVVRENGSLDFNNQPSLMSSPSLSSMSNDDDDDNDLPEMKQLRLEERAKYYLENDQNAFDTFLTYNTQYDKGYLSAQALLQSYKELFKTPQSDIYLLTKNLAKTYSKDSKKHKELYAIFEAHEQRMYIQNELPSLTNSSLSLSANKRWTGQGAAPRDARNMSLPTLERKSKSFDPFATTVKKTLAPRTVVRTVRTVNKSVGGPMGNRNNLGGSASLSSEVKEQSSYPSLSSLTTTTLPTKNVANAISFTSSSSNKSKTLRDLNLPQLPTPKPKVYIPPVKKTHVPDPKKWGGGIENTGTSLQSSLSTSSLPSLNSTVPKGRKAKQKQLLFHIGV